MEMTEAKQIAQCGETYQVILDAFDTRLGRDNGVMFIAGLLSDAQELVYQAGYPELDGQTRQARLNRVCQVLNGAKYLMFARLDGLVPPAEVEAA
jgi:hypothetical protein